ncbi:hypothetical protein KN10_1642 [Anoxybacillus flavithermus NBRC 109594]|uniref:Uncharacterized protein n=1 Tax=Anoxybacillus flavithermus NBRC 109594 TaxID=1315967 RepID=R4FCJ5_9BACL|nr:hypothetical protein KN10_1642 [Anoxybacillus flavithermus NBRC 109594]
MYPAVESKAPLTNKEKIVLKKSRRFIRFNLTYEMFFTHYKRKKFIKTAKTMLKIFGIYSTIKMNE